MRVNSGSHSAKANFPRPGLRNTAPRNRVGVFAVLLLGALSVVFAASQTQTITFGPLSTVTLGTAPFTIGATASSGLTVSFASTTPGVCTVSGNTVTILAAGTCSITASQAGNANYTAATPVSQSFTVQAAQTITFTLTAPGAIMTPFGPVNNVKVGIAPFTISATASSGLTVSFASTTPVVCTVSGNTVTILAAGTCSITASQAGNASYAAAPPVTQSFSVTPGSSTTTLQIPGGGGTATVSLMSGTVSTAYSQLLPASNGTPPYSWSVLGGALPQGLSLSQSGTLSGTPSQAGTFTFTAKVTDSAGATATSMFSIIITPQSLTITTASPLPNGIVGSDYPAQIFTATGGNAPYTFRITGGALPGGLALTAGEISGSPTTSGVFNFTVTGTDSSVPPALTASAPFQLTVQQAGVSTLILSQASLAFSLKLGATGLPSGDNVSVRSSLASQLLNYSVTVNPAVTWLDVTGGGTIAPFSTTTPGAIGVALDPKALSLGAGVSQTSVVVTCIAPSPCAGSSQTVGVSLTVTAAAPQLSVTSSLLSFSAQTSNAAPVSQSLGLQNVGGGAITVNSITAVDSFVTISGVPSTIAAGPAIPVTVTVNPANLAAGNYQSTIFVETSAGSTTVPVTLLVAQNPTMTLSPAGAQFQQTAGSSPGNPNGSFLVAVSGNSTISWSAVQLPGASWLTLNTTSGTSTSASPGTVRYSINPAVAATLTAQTYFGQIQVSSSGVVDSPLTFIVVLTVAPAGSFALPNPTPAGLLFLSSATAPAPQTVQIFTSSATAVSYQTSSDSPWLLVSPSSGSTSTASAGSSSVSVDLSGLAAGVYRGNVSYALASAAVRTVNVTLIVEAAAGASDRTDADPASTTALPRATCGNPPGLVPTSTSLVNNFSSPAAFPTPLSVVLEDSCEIPIANAQVIASFNNGDPPLTLIATDTTSGNYTATWTPHNIGQDLQILFTATLSGFPTATVTLSGQVSPNNAAPLLTQTLGAGTLLPTGSFAPGDLILLKGTGLADQQAAATSPLQNQPLAGALVTFDGAEIQLLYADPGQVVGLVPLTASPNSMPPLAVLRDGAPGSAVMVTVSTTHPAILTADGSGQGQGLVYKANGATTTSAATTLANAANPVNSGDNIIVYSTGLGTTNATSGTASNTPVLTIGGLPAQISYAGVALPASYPASGAPALLPGGLASAGLGGLYQINATVPTGMIGGPVPVTVSAAGFGPSQTGVIMVLSGASAAPAVISSLNPSSAAAGGPAFTLAVNGSGFANGAIVNWANGATTALTTTFVSATQLTAAVPAALIANAGTASVAVTNPGGQASTAFSFTITAAVAAPPTITSISPSSATAGSPPVTVTVTGTAFVNGARVQFNGLPLSTTFVSATTLTAQIPASDLVSPGTGQITVLNPSGPASNSLSFSVLPMSSASALQFMPVAPCRVLDTRTPANGSIYAAGSTFGSPGIAAGTVRTIPIPASTNCPGIPANAAAYSLNFTVQPGTANQGYLTVWPAGTAQPNVSTVSFSNPAVVLAAAGIVPAGAGGAINATATQDIDLIVDINGYFVPPAAGTLQFYPLAPCRVLDTRTPANGGSFPANSPFGSPSLDGVHARSFVIPSSPGNCGAPATAAAYSFNVGVVPQGALYFLAAYPTGGTLPVVSTMNSFDGTILANAAIVPAGPGGAVNFFASNPADFFVDINGYFAPPGGSGGLNFYTVPPCRLVDTRNADGTFGGPTFNTDTIRSFPLPQSSCGIPSGTAVQAYSLGITVYPVGGGLYYLTTWPTGEPQPFASTLNAIKPLLPIANAALVPAGTGGAISLFTTNPTDVTIDTAGYFGP